MAAPQGAERFLVECLGQVPRVENTIGHQRTKKHSIFSSFI
jgi:hypothetical protein